VGRGDIGVNPIRALRRLSSGSHTPTWEYVFTLERCECEVIVGGVRLGVWGVVLVVCVCVSVSRVLFSVGVCVCDLLICLRIPVAQPQEYESRLPPGLPCI